MPTQAQLFLQLYNRLDHKLRTEMQQPPHVSHSELLNRKAHFDPYVREHLSELQAYRSLRNAIVHMPSHASHDGEPIADPLPEVVVEYGKLVAYILQPPPALQTQYVVREVYTVAWTDSVLEQLTVLYSKEYRIAPVVQDGVLRGIFSDTVLGRHWVATRRMLLDDQLRFSDFAALCCDERAAGFRLVAATATIEELEQQFQQAFDNNMPLSVVCVTEHGQLGEPLLGLSTPHDLPRARGTATPPK